MINVNQLTAEFARMSDQALKQYAQMHKDDPYTLSLALSESNRRKQTRQAAQRQAQDQPDVVDTEIAEMATPAPEDVGIAQLPVGDMNYADGGIVAFSDGGVPRYQSQGLVRPGPGLYETDPRLAREAAERARIYRDFYRLGRSPVGAAAGAAGPAAALALVPAGMAYGLTSAMDDMRAQGYPVDPMGEFSTGAATPEQAEFDAARRQRISQGQAQQRAEETRLTAALAGQEPLAPPATGRLSAGDITLRKQPAAAPDPGANQGQRSPAPPGSRPPAAPAAPAAAQDPLISQLLKPVQPAAVNYEPSQATMPTAEGIQNLFAASRPKPEDVVDPFAEQRQELTNLATLQNAQEQADLERRIKERGQLGEKQEARLKAREEKLGKQEKDLGPLAMIQAGFAIMGGQSRSALQNIGMGAQVGLKGYTEGVEKLQNARERIEDGLERIETARRSEGILNDQQRSALKREGNAIVRDGKKAGIDALTTEFGVKRAEANTLFSTGINVLTKKGEIGSAERLGAAQMQESANRAAMQQGAENVRAAVQANTARQNALTQAGAQLGLLRAIANDPKLQAVYGKGQGQNKIMDEFNDFMKANPQYLTNESAALQAFLRTKGVLSSLGGAGAASAASTTPGPVLPRKD